MNAKRGSKERAATAAMSETGDLRGRRLHFVAIGGAGMSALALVCDHLGAEVTGTDRAESSYVERLRRAGLEPRIGHDAAAVPEDAEVIRATAVPDDNPELVRARERGQPILHRGELLAELCSLRRLIAVAGTHGKTTTAGMLVTALRAAGADPPFLLGGELPGAAPDGGPTNAAWGEGEWMVAEGDESDASFLLLRPEIAVVTNVELDHHSHWSSRAELTDAFRRFAAPAAGLARGTDAAVGEPGAQRVIRFGIAPESGPEPPAELTAEGIAPREGGGTRFTLGGPAGSGEQVALTVPGRHNVLNALAALAALRLAEDRDGLPPLASLAEALAGFRGIARRLERRGASSAGALVYDDYAHHPTEVAASLAALRELPHRRLIAVFQPHLYSRTKALAARFGAALAVADEVGVLEVYPARERPVGELAGVTGRWIAEAAADRAGGRPVWWLRDLEAAERALAPRLGDGDLLVTLGAGDIHELAGALVDRPAPAATSAAGSGKTDSATGGRS